MGAEAKAKAETEAVAVAAAEEEAESFWERVNASPEWGVQVREEGQLAVTVASCCLSSGVSVSFSEACWSERGYSGCAREVMDVGVTRLCLQQNRVISFFIWFKVQMGRMQPVVTASKDPFLHQSPSSAPPLSSAAEQSFCYPIFNSRYNGRMQPVVMAPKNLSTKPRTTEEKTRQKTRGKQIETYTGRARTSCAELGRTSYGGEITGG